MPSMPAFRRFVARGERSRSGSLFPSSDDISDDISDNDSRPEEEVEHVTWRTSDTPRPRKTTAPSVAVSHTNLSRHEPEARTRPTFPVFRPLGLPHTNSSHHPSGEDVTDSPGQPTPSLRPLSRGELNSYNAKLTRSGRVALNSAADDTCELMIRSDDIEDESDLSLDIERKRNNDSDSEGSQSDVYLSRSKQGKAQIWAAPKRRADRHTGAANIEEDSDSTDVVLSQKDSVSRVLHPSKVRIIDDIESQVPSLPKADPDPIEDPSQVLDTQLREQPAVIRYSRAGVIDLDLVTSSIPHSTADQSAEAEEVPDKELEDGPIETPLKTSKTVWPRFLPLTPSSSGKTKPLVTGSEIARRIQQRPFDDISCTPPYSTSKVGYAQTPTVSKSTQQNKSQPKFRTGIAELVASWVVKVHSDVQLNSLAGDISPSVNFSKRRMDSKDAARAAPVKMRRGPFEFWKVALNNKGYSYGSKNYAGFTLVRLQRCEMWPDDPSDDGFGIQGPGDGDIAWAFLFDATNVSSVVANSSGLNDASLTTAMLSDRRLSKGTILRLCKPVWRVQLTDRDMNEFAKAGYDCYSDTRGVLVCINWQVLE
ncbi:hypothetical protein V1517DRAFT_252295 [Lipomyces orientalis]|uniref:Uncharacterized protein n=1 Tax=Lipomyces orientalis TaxID=1233043 RepID=A0ACC3TYX4_9ASCO